MQACLRGMLPVGISFGFSWILTFCQSENRLCSTFSCHAFLFPHVGLGQMRGSVYLNCCSTSLTRPPQFAHSNAPYMSSGRTSDVRVTVPETDINVPIRCVRRSRIDETSGRL